MKLSATLLFFALSTFIIYNSSSQTSILNKDKAATEKAADNAIAAKAAGVLQNAPSPRKQENEHSKEEAKFVYLNSQPSFPGGEEELRKFLKKNLKYPAEALKNGHEDIVVVQFVVNADGKISNIEVVKQLGMGTNEEAVRLVTLMPKWLPAQLDGKPVSIRHMLPIRFSLD